METLATRLESLFSDSALCHPDVFQNGTRNYVQGTQMLAAAARAVYERIDVNATVSAATFTRITQNRIGLSPDDASSLDPAADLGTAKFSVAGETVTLRFAELPEPAPRRDVPESITYELVEKTNALSGTFSYGNVLTFEDRITVFVQCIKSLHSALPGTPHDIWFTGCRRATFSLEPETQARSGRLEIACNRVIGKSPQYQSLNTITMHDDGGEPQTAVITFAVKAERSPDVN